MLYVLAMLVDAVHHFSPDNFGWIVVKFCTGSYDPQRTIPIGFDEPLIFVCSATMWSKFLLIQREI